MLHTRMRIRILRLATAFILAFAFLLINVFPALGVDYTLSISENGTGTGTVTSNPAGIDCGLSCIYAFPEGTNVTLTASKNNGSIFAGWSGDVCSGIGICIVKMDSVKSIIATFTADPTPPTITNVAPVTAAHINNVTNASAVNYTVSEAIASGKITIKQTGGTTDSSSPHICTLTGTALNSGVHNALDLSNTTNGCTVAQSLVSGAIYTFNFDAVDGAGNVATTVSNTDVTFDSTLPNLNAVSIQSNNANIAWAKVDDSVTLTFSSSESIVTPTVTIGSQVVTASGGPTSWSASRTMLASDAVGPVAFSISFRDLAGNSGAAVSTTTDASTVTLDKTAPTIGIGSPSASATKAGPVSYTVTYGDDHFNASNLASGDITLNTSGTANGTVGVDAGAGITRTVTISGITGDGTLAITIGAGTASDMAGNPAPASGKSIAFSVDNTSPTLISSSPANGSINILPNTAVTINWSEPVNCSTVTTSTVIISPGAWLLTSCSASQAVFTPSGQANSTIYTVTVGAGTGVTDLIGNVMSPTQFSYTTGLAVTKFYLHNATTTVTGTLPSATDLSNAQTPTVTASGASTNRVMNASVGTAQMSAALTTSAVTSAQFNWFRRFVSPPLATQTLPGGIWTLQAGASEQNANSNMLCWYPVIVVYRPSTGTTVVTLNDAITSTTTEPTTSETNVSRSTSSVSAVPVQEGDVLVLEVWTRNTQSSATAYNNTIFYDGITEGSATNNAAVLNAPGTLFLDQTAPTNEDSVFNTGLSVKGGTTVTITSSGDASNTVWFAPAGTTVFTAGPTMTSVGGVATSIPAPATEGSYKLYVLDSAGNRSNPSTAALLVDNTGPTVTINQASGQSDPTKAATINFTVVFSEAVNNFATGDVALSGTAGATTSVVTGSGMTYEVAVTGMTVDGTIIASVAAAKATDAAGNDNTASSSLDNTVTFDTTAPTAAITYSVAGPYALGVPVTITATFNEAMLDSPAPQISISGTNTLAATPMSKSTSTIYTYVYSVGPGNGAATIAMSIGTDLAGNAVTPTPTSGATFMVDNTGPVITITNPNTTPAKSKTITATTSEGSLSMSNTTGSICDNLLTFLPYSSQTFILESDNGKKVCYKAVDIAGNAVFNMSNPIAGIDTTSPRITNVSSSTANGAYPSGSNILLTVTLNEAVDVSGPTPSITLETGITDRTATYSGGSGTNTLTFAYSVQPGDNSADLDYSATNSFSSNNGTLRDAALNDIVLTLPVPGSAGSLGANKAIVIDTLAPTISIGLPTVSSTKNGPVSFIATYTDTNFFASTLVDGNITLNKSGDAAGMVSVTGSGQTRTVTISNITGNGTLGISIASGTARDTAGNLAAGAGPSTTFMVDITLPSLAWTAPVPCGQASCYYDVPNQTMQLAVNASDIAGISRVVFRRWDKVSNWIEITTLYSSPYSISFDTSVLLPEWNEIDVKVYDSANNFTLSSIFLYHSPNWINYLPLIKR